MSSLNLSNKIQRKKVMANSINGDDRVDSYSTATVSSSSQTLVFPEDVIINEILPRLPVKSLIRFKSVCKLWHSTISSINFVKNHFNFSSDSAHHFILHGWRTSTLNLLPYDELNNLNADEMVAIDVSRFETERHVVTDCRACDGLLLLRFRYINTGNNSTMDDESDLFAIYNPASHKYAEIAIPDHQQCLVTYSYWFGYVPSINDYRIVAHFYHVDYEGYYGLGNYYVYSLRSGTWKMLPDLYRILSVTETLSRNTILVDDLLYWSPIIDEWKPPKTIVRFDLVIEQVEKLPLMDWLSVYRGTEFLKLNGCLSLYCNFKDPFSPVSDVWRLKRHDDWSSWEISFSIHHGGLSLYSVVPTGKFLVAGYDEDTGIFQYKLIDASNNSQQLQGDSCFLHEEIGGGSGRSFYVESLIWPLGAMQSIDEDSAIDFEKLRSPCEKESCYFGGEKKMLRSLQRDTAEAVQAGS